MNAELAWILSAASGCLSVWVGVSLTKQKEIALDKDRKIDKLQDEVAKLKAVSVDEPRVREIAYEVMRPMKEGQDEIKVDIKSLIDKVTDLSISFARASGNRRND